MANEKRLIDANALTSEFEWLKSVVNESSKDEIQDVIQRIKNAPTVDAVEVVHGLWKDVKETDLYVPDMRYTTTHTAQTCSICNVRIGFVGSKLYLYDGYCPNCGAKMDGGDND